MRIIPAIDIINGKCVRLSKGDYSTQKIYNESPLEVAKEFEANGIKYLHLVDLDGAKSNQVVNHKVLNEIARSTNLKIDFGGGIKSHEDLRIAFENGASQVTAGSVAVTDPSLFKEWLKTFGPERIVLGADCLNRKIATGGWIDNTDIDVIDFIKRYHSTGVKHVICTDISKDGMLQGTSLELYRGILSKTSIRLVASGGVASIIDVIELLGIGCEGVIIGKAIYEQKITLKELSRLC